MAPETENNPELTERQEQWRRLSDEVEDLADKLGKPIDEGIKEAVIGLHAHGIETAQSCEGHDDHGHALSMVLIESEEPPDREKDPALNEAWIASNRGLVEKVRAMVDEWYRSREEAGEVLAEERRLVLEPRGLYGAADLQSASQERLSALPETQRKKQAGEYRDEMRKFSEYMKERFLNGFSS